MWWQIVGVIVAAYLIECLIFPMRRHRMCRGSGQLVSPLTRSWRPCSCGTGQVPRLGYRIVAGFFGGR